MTANAGGEPRPIAGATQERRLLGVGSSAWFGWGYAPSTALQNPCTRHAFALASHASQGRDSPSSSEPTPSSGHRHTQLLTDACRRELRDLAMARYRGPSMRSWIFPNRMFSAFPHEPTTVLPQVAEQLAPFHGTAVWGTTRICDAAVSSK